MTIKVTEEMMLHRAEVDNYFDAVEIPGQVKPGWEEVSAFLEQILTPNEEINQ